MDQYQPLWQISLRPLHKRQSDWISDERASPRAGLAIDIVRKYFPESEECLQINRYSTRSSRDQNLLNLNVVSLAQDGKEAPSISDCHQTAQSKLAS